MNNFSQLNEIAPPDFGRASRPDFHPLFSETRHANLEAPDFISRQTKQARCIYLNLTPDKRQPLVIVCAGWERSAPDYVINRPDFPFYSIEFVTAGQGCLQLAGRKCGLKPGSVFSYCPNVPHRIETDPENLLEKYFVDFCGTESRPLLERFDLSAGTHRHVPSLFEVHDAFERLLRLGSHPAGIPTRAYSLQFELLLVSTLTGEAAPSDHCRQASATFSRCLEKMNQNFLQYGSVEEVAAECNVRPAYLCRLFQRYSRLSPYSCLLRLKMNWAANRLQNSEILVKQVADELHLDQFQFSRVFKRIHGMSPTAFMHQQRPTFGGAG